MDDLDYEKHLEDYKQLLGYYNENSNKEQVLKSAEENAQDLHMFSVFNPLRDWGLKAVMLAKKLKNDNARYYMQYGAGRRLNMVFYSYQTITHIAPSGRTKPLSYEEQMELSRDINTIYINLRGVLDNFAWCFLYERHPELESKISPYSVGLFSKKLRDNCPRFAEIQNEITAHDEWYKEVKERRDPVAHRVPLYVPSTMLSNEEEKKYEELNASFCENIADLESNEADAAFEQMHQIGTFSPYFFHHPTEPGFPLYPTIPTDMAHLIRIGEAVEKGLFQ
ncbi:MAG: hypothetical protein KC643_15450 [Nitrospira sp.]|nr:hypothetical protein [Nitrospira sp.]